MSMNFLIEKTSLRSQAHWLVAQKSQRTTKTSQRACLPQRIDRKTMQQIYMSNLKTRQKINSQPLTAS